MESLLTIVCYKDSEIIDGPNGVCYSCPPKKGVLVNNFIKYDELEDKLCHVMSINRAHTMLSMIFRYPILSQIPPSNTIEMYCRHVQGIIHLIVTQSVMGVTNNYVDIPFTNENDDVEFYDEDEINEMHYDDEPPTNKVSSDDGEHIMPSPMFKQLNWDAINSMIAEPLTPRTGVWNESNELFKGLRFESKEDLQYAVKRYAICRNQHLVVCESEPQLWAVRCKKWQEGCNWRLRACRRKSHGMFEIIKYVGPHTCVYPKLSQDHSQLDSTLIAREIQNVVQRDHTTSIATLHQIVKDKFGYDVHYRRIWEAKRKAMLRVFGD
ncbi:hypothetical protein CK203_034566 [Vitis vinifera]|uniref:Transposase MuDR plant domain-containing protein n=1 Tax=Vitis vinifera TaxID=29760 RepID=A0A438IDY0_VITVI|nr:hypothetical protein CK203_034566 [Vitis vinifera]